MTDNFIWTPPGMEEPGLQEFLSLRNGIPENANESIHRWLVSNRRDSEYFDWKFMTDFQQAARTDFGFYSVSLVQVTDAFKIFRKMSKVHRTWLTDFMLSMVPPKAPGYGEPDRVVQLKKILRDCGSSWTTGIIQGRYRLVDALPGAVAEIVENTLSPADKASTLLRSAWESAFGMNSKPSHAYYDAVRSVEVLSCPLISPKDANATLGKDINVLRGGPHKWSFAMEGSARTSSVEHLTGMMQLLWHSQTDRHGRADYEDVSLEESQAAVLLASTLVGWLAKGFLSRSE